MLITVEIPQLEFHERNRLWTSHLNAQRANLTTEELDSLTGRFKFNGGQIRRVVTTARDLARMGLLMLTGGVWRGQRLVNEDVMALAFDSSQSMNPAYGLLWWVNGKRSWDDWTNTGMRTGSFIPAAPDDLIAARGIGDRKIYVVPSVGLVVTRLGGFATRDDDGEPDRQFFDREFWRLLMHALP